VSPPLRRRITFLLASVVVATLGVIGFFAATAWRPVHEVVLSSERRPSDLILSNDSYASLIDTHARPYVFNSQRGPGQVLVYGAEHVRDPADPRCAEIERAWNEFHPTVALVESRLGIMFPQLMDPVRTFGEPGLVHALARRDGVPTYTWEPPVATLVKSVLDQGFTREQVALRMHLGSYFSNLRHGRPKDPEAFVRDTFARRNRWPGIEDAFASIADLDAAWKREFPGGPDWRDVSDEFGLPGFLARMDLNLARDQHLVAVVNELTARHQRVFVIAGSSHAVKVHPALQPSSDGGSGID
jgi:hypothetical protein